MKKDEFLKNQGVKYKLGVIDRRQFISSAIATGLAVPAALGLAAQVKAATPKKGGVLRHASGYGSTDDSLDPGTSANSLSQNVIYTPVSYTHLTLPTNREV